MASVQLPVIAAPPSVNSGVRSVTESRFSVLPAGATIATSTKPRSLSSRMPLESPSEGPTRPPVGPSTSKLCVSARFECVAVPSVELNVPPTISTSTPPGSKRPLVRVTK